MSQNFRQMVGEKRISAGMYWTKAWSLVSGCSPVSEGCRNCWLARETYIRGHQKNPKIRRRYENLAEKVIIPDHTNLLAEGKTQIRFRGDIRLNHEDLEKPLMRKKPTVWNIWSDLFHPDVPYGFIEKAFEVMDKTPQHIYLILTKRPERIPGLPIHWKPEWKNIWMGTTVESYDLLDNRVGNLLYVTSAIRFVSLEPMLGPVDLSGPLGIKWSGLRGCWINNPDSEKTEYNNYAHHRPPINWVIVGGESGPNARPMNPQWVRYVRDQCVAAGVPVFVKQMQIENKVVHEIEKFPKDLQIREFPNVL